MVSNILCAWSTDSLSSGRLLSSSLSRGCSPISSPKGDMCKQGHKKAPRQDSRLQLSLSRESLDSGRESPVELEHIKSENQNEAEATGLDSALGDEPVRDCDNATTVSELESNGCTEDSIDLEASQDQRDRICLEPIYDLYAISVSIYTLTLVLCVQNYCPVRCWFWYGHFM